MIDAVPNRGCRTRPLIFGRANPADLRESDSPAEGRVRHSEARARHRVTLTRTLTVESGKSCTLLNNVKINHIYVSSKTGK